VRVGEFDHRSAIASIRLNQELDREELLSHITPFEGLLPEFPKIIIGPAGKRGVINGRFLETKDIVKIIGSGQGIHFRIFDEEGNFLAVAKKDDVLRRFNPTIVFHP
jgi:tRNA U55 pseudouridine synthase TruB